MGKNSDKPKANNGFYPLIIITAVSYFLINKFTNAFGETPGTAAIILTVIIYGVFVGLSLLLFNIVNGFVNSPFAKGKNLDALFEPVYPPLSADNLIKQLRAQLVIFALPIPVSLIIFAITRERFLLQAVFFFIVINIFGLFYKTHGLSILETIKTIEKRPEFAKTVGLARFIEAKMRAKTPLGKLPSAVFIAPPVIENGYDYLLSYYTYGRLYNKGNISEAFEILERMINATPSYIAQNSRDEIAAEYAQLKTEIADREERQ
ncbi:MAG: hypothetical protein LBL87_07870 [Ruminococcus sp.]|jgi:hypothetical protein|nr:hypothetical protein [Ruminococcus sp.]